MINSIKCFIGAHEPVLCDDLFFQFACKNCHRVSNSIEKQGNEWAQREMIRILKEKEQTQ